MKTTKYKRIPIEKVILGTIATVGVLAAVAVAPGVGPALHLFGYGRRKYPKRYITSALVRMKTKGYIVFEEREGKKYIRITSKGKRELERYNRERTITTPRRWDGKWRIVIFDIPEKKRWLRDKIRHELKQAGFSSLQKSVWICPYECEEFVTLLKADNRIGKNVLYVEAAKVEYDKSLKQIFKIDI